MIYLLLSILCSSLIFLIFKAYSKYSIHTFSAIVFNYITAALVGFAINVESIEAENILHATWLPYSFFLGFIFISMFNVMAITTQKLGASVGSIANKMALIVPVIFAIVYYNDTVTVLKISGIILALIGILLATLKPKTLERHYHRSDLLYPLVLLIGSGFIDTYVKYMEEYLLKDSYDFQLFSSFTFLTAALIGLLLMLFRKKSRSLQLKTIGGGISLGVINFGAIYFLLETFRRSNLESSVVFPFNNLGVVLLTSLLSYFLFKERFSNMNKIGIALSLLAVLLIAAG